MVSLHGLRHSAGPIMLAAGVPLIVVCRMLGHADPQVTASVYAHLLGDGQLDLAADVFAVPEIAGTVEETVEKRPASAE